MSNLHLVQGATSWSEFSENVHRYCSTNDTILFLNDALFSLIENDFSGLAFNDLTANVTLSLIKEQAVARAVDNIIEQQIKRVDYQKFVELTASSQKTISW